MLFCADIRVTLVENTTLTFAWKIKEIFSCGNSLSKYIVKIIKEGVEKQDIFT